MPHVTVVPVRCNPALDEVQVVEDTWMVHVAWAGGKDTVCGMPVMVKAIAWITGTSESASLRLDISGGGA